MGLPPPMCLQCWGIHSHALPVAYRGCGTSTANVSPVLGYTFTCSAGAYIHMHCLLHTEVVGLPPPMCLQCWGIHSHALPVAYRGCGTSTANVSPVLGYTFTCTACCIQRLWDFHRQCVSSDGVYIHMHCLLHTEVVGLPPPMCLQCWGIHSHALPVVYRGCGTSTANVSPVLGYTFTCTACCIQRLWDFHRQCVSSAGVYIHMHCLLYTEVVGLPPPMCLQCWGIHSHALPVAYRGCGTSTANVSPVLGHTFTCTACCIQRLWDFHRQCVSSAGAYIHMHCLLHTEVVGLPPPMCLQCWGIHSHALPVAYRGCGTSTANVSPVLGYTFTCTACCIQRLWDFHRQCVSSAGVYIHMHCLLHTEVVGLPPPMCLQCWDIHSHALPVVYRGCGTSTANVSPVMGYTFTCTACCIQMLWDFHRQCVSSAGAYIHMHCLLHTEVVGLPPPMCLQCWGIHSHALPVAYRGCGTSTANVSPVLGYTFTCTACCIQMLWDFHRQCVSSAGVYIHMHCLLHTEVVGLPPPMCLQCWGIHSHALPVAYGSCGSSTTNVSPVLGYTFTCTACCIR